MGLMNVFRALRGDTLREGCNQDMVVELNADLLSRSVGTSRKLRPEGVFVPFLIVPKNVFTA